MVRKSDFAYFICRITAQRRLCLLFVCLSTKHATGSTRRDRQDMEYSQWYIIKRKNGVENMFEIMPCNTRFVEGSIVLQDCSYLIQNFRLA